MKRSGIPSIWVHTSQVKPYLVMYVLSQHYLEDNQTHIHPKKSFLYIPDNESEQVVLGWNTSHTPINDSSGRNVVL